MALTHKQLLAALHYDPDTGEWTWRSPRKKIRVGQRAGSVRPDGYRHIGLCGARYLEHVLAVFYMTGSWPVAEVDHRDLNRSNGRWNNLRQSDYSQNKMNRHVRSDSVSGVKGVAKHQKGYRARITAYGSVHDLGVHATPEAASSAYSAAAQKLHGEFSNTQTIGG